MGAGGCCEVTATSAPRGSMTVTGLCPPPTHPATQAPATTAVSDKRRETGRSPVPSSPSEAPPRPRLDCMCQHACIPRCPHIWPDVISGRVWVRWADMAGVEEGGGRGPRAFSHPRAGGAAGSPGCQALGLWLHCFPRHPFSCWDCSASINT